MTLPSGHVFQNSNFGNLRLSTLALRYGGSPQYWIFTHEQRKNICFFETWMPERGEWNESGFRPPLCTYRLNWARRTSWGWWDEWDDTVRQTQDSKFEPWRSEAEHATSRWRSFTRGWGRNVFVFFQTAETGNRTLAVLTTTLGPPPARAGDEPDISDVPSRQF